MSGIFSSLKVIEVTEDIAGSLTAQMCADRGAEVIKIEPPEGDPLRHVDPYGDKESKLFESLNRGKQSVVLDIRDDRGIRLIRQLCAVADIIIISMPKNPCPADLSYESLKSINPGLIYLDIRAFGERGRWTDCAANDLVLQAYSGSMLSEGKTENDSLTPKPIVSSQMSEYVTAFYGVLGISSALYHRAGSGEGQRIATSKLHTLLSIQSARIVTNDMADEQIPGFRRTLSELRAIGASLEEIKKRRLQSAPRVINAFYRPYQTRDGAIFIGALTLRLRDRAREVLNTTLLGRDDPDYDAADDEYYENAMRQQAEIESFLKKKSTAHWISVLEEAGVPTGEITFPEDLFDSDQLIENNYINYIEHASGSQLHVMPHAQFAAFPNPQLRSAPDFSENTSDVLSTLE